MVVMYLRRNFVNHWFTTTEGIKKVRPKHRSEVKGETSESSNITEKLSLSFKHINYNSISYGISKQL